MTQILDVADAYALWAETYPPYAHNALMLAEERAFMTLLPPDMRGLSVLDIGCGSGRYLKRIMARGAAQTTGLDLSRPMLKRAYIEHPDLVESSASHIPLRNDVADCVVCALTLGHIESLGNALAEISRMLKPSGLLVASDFHPIGAAFGWQRTFKHQNQRYAVRHFTHTLDDWRRACQAASLTVEAHMEAFVDPRDVPSGATVDPRALDYPVAHVLGLRKRPGEIQVSA